MKHASQKTLSTLESLLKKVRELPDLKEKKLGIFYRKSNAFLHFHEDPTGLYADYKVNTEWIRQAINTECEQNSLLHILRGITSS